MPILTGIKFDRRRESQKTIVTIEFTTSTLSGVRNFIKIEVFSVFHPKLWPNRWQVPTITGANMDRHQKLQKMIITIEFTALDLCRVQNFIKTEAFAFFIQSYGQTGANIGRCQESQKTISSMNSAFSNCTLSKISWKMVNLIPHSTFHFLSHFNSECPRKTMNKGLVIGNL